MNTGNSKYRDALERGKRESLHYATEVHVDGRSVVLSLVSGQQVTFPVDLAPKLSDAPQSTIESATLVFGGAGLQFGQAEDMTFYVPSLVRGNYGAKA
ncbi:hypothetical protein [Paraburkholderia monticola]|uniref:hypothetical protein n=1 Tax=Paraburkholderia monticola TaxID=1399968 RepID=UPI000A638D9C|nr:hypothetical protein [Paraburkholderia monticola]